MSSLFVVRRTLAAFSGKVLAQTATDNLMIVAEEDSQIHTLGFICGEPCCLTNEAHSTALRSVATQCESRAT
jgi:hypothetical protein